jgi:hypothetical protein
LFLAGGFGEMVLEMHTRLSTHEAAVRNFDASLDRSNNNWTATSQSLDKWQIAMLSLRSTLLVEDDVAGLVDLSDEQEILESSVEFSFGTRQRTWLARVMPWMILLDLGAIADQQPALSLVALLLKSTLIAYVWRAKALDDVLLALGTETLDQAVVMLNQGDALLGQGDEEETEAKLVLNRIALLRDFWDDRVTGVRVLIFGDRAARLSLFVLLSLLISTFLHVLRVSWRRANTFGRSRSKAS